MYIIATLVAVFLILVFNELWWRKRTSHGEFSRKFVHVTVGTLVAFWPFYLSWPAIEFLSLAFILVVAISKYLKIFQAVHSVQRPTWGELFFGLSVGLIALLTHDKWIYMAAVLQMALADGLAAIIGLRYGGRQSYLVFDHSKSVIGTLTFFVTSLAIMTFYIKFSHAHLGLLTVALISLGASILENIAVYGLDNLLVPLLVAVLLVHH